MTSSIIHQSSKINQGTIQLDFLELSPELQHRPGYIQRPYLRFEGVVTKPLKVESTKIFTKRSIEKGSF